MMTMRKTSITSGQEKQYRRLLDDAKDHGIELALKKVPLDTDGMQMILSHGDEIRDAVAETIVAKTKEFSVSNQFANEEVKSSYAYPDGYAVKTLEQQTDILRKVLPALSTGSDVGGHVAFLDAYRANTKLPVGAEGFFIVPRWQKIAGTYGDALETVLALLAKSRNFYNWRSGQLGKKQLRQSVRTSAMLAKLAEGQPGDFIILPAQLGLRHRGRSVRRAREVFLGNEFGLDAFTVACILLTHPEREQVWEQLHIDCAGDEYSPDAGGQFDRAPRFDFGDGRLKFGSVWVGHAFGRYGSASGFSPQ
jgi:hypothetical protein